MIRELFSKLNLVRLGLALAMIALIALAMPRTDHQSYVYELNQPWRYPLLTAPFDMPVYRDSASAHALRDSIDRAFIPFVMRDRNVVERNIERFSKLGSTFATPSQVSTLSNALSEVYARGVIDPEVYDKLRKSGQSSLRLDQEKDGDYTVASIDASAMLSPAKAFEYIDSLCGQNLRIAGSDKMNTKLISALNVCLTPNVLLDTVADAKFRNREYLDVTGAQGVIKKGQRIVDRGEIVSPQVFTNLNTYQEMLSTSEGASGAHEYFSLGHILYLALSVALLYMFLAVFRPRFYASIRNMTFLISLLTLFVIFAIVMFDSFASGIYLVPFAAVPVIVRVFFDSRTAIFSHLVTVMICALVATFQFEFIFTELSVGIIATLGIRQLSRRSQLLRVGVMTFIAYTVCYIIGNLIAVGDLSSFSWRMPGVFAINSVILSFAYVLIVVIERIFGFTSTVTLVELSDINSRLLRRLAEEAPGTFQHSMQVSTLAAEAARAVGANTQLVRTGALYHDIGKLDSPIFFTENQHGVNPHAGLDPSTSAKKIISHVTGGLNLASKEKLPSVIKDFIAQHHGKGLVKYFYTMAMNDAAAKGEEDKVDKNDFTYPGPNPQTKETAILMMADAVEAASRSLKDYSPEAIDALVDKIIDGQAADGLFNDSPISYNDVQRIKETFKKRLATIYHSRIAYPELSKEAREATKKE